MRPSFWIGRRLFGLGRIFEPGTPPGYRRSWDPASTVEAFSLGRWGLVWITFPCRRPSWTW